MTKELTIVDNGRRPRGRPPLFATVEKYEEAVDRFFGECKEADVTPTWTLLTNALGFCALSHHRQWLERKQDDERFDDYATAYKRARLRIVASLEHDLVSGKGYGPGIMFALCNLTRTEREDEDVMVNPQRVELTGRGGKDLVTMADLVKAVAAGEVAGVTK